MLHAFLESLNQDLLASILLIYLEAHSPRVIISKAPSNLRRVGSPLPLVLLHLSFPSIASILPIKPFLNLIRVGSPSRQALQFWGALGRLSLLCSCIHPSHQTLSEADSRWVAF